MGPVFFKNNFKNFVFKITRRHREMWSFNLRVFSINVMQKSRKLND